MRKTPTMHVYASLARRKQLTKRYGSWSINGAFELLFNGHLGTRQKVSKTVPCPSATRMCLLYDFAYDLSNQEPDPNLSSLMKYRTVPHLVQRIALDINVKTVWSSHVCLKNGHCICGQSGIALALTVRSTHQLGSHRIASLKFSIAPSKSFSTRARNRP